MDRAEISRKDLLKTMLLAAASLAVPQSVLGQPVEPAPGAITLEDLRVLQKTAGIELDDASLQEILDMVNALKPEMDAVRAEPMDYRLEPSTVFTPLGAFSDPDARVRARSASFRRLRRADLSEEDLAFASIAELGHLLRSRQVSSVELTKLYLDRLERWGEALLCVAELTPEIAMRQARRADDELAKDEDRGPLHGIPYGIKDLFAAKGTRTGWGADYYKNRSYEYDASVVRRLEDAGAVLVAKLSMGGLALGDQWHRGMTRNPWNREQGSSGSSAGSASATAAGLVAFAIGTETQGSIVSPSNQCRVTGFRPTYGRVSRAGAMALSYTMDKVGPICRSVDDCALVFAAICGADPDDPSTVDREFVWPREPKLRELKVGVLVNRQSDESLQAQVESYPLVDALREAGAQISAVEFTPNHPAVTNILGIESASAFEAFARTEEIGEMQPPFWRLVFRSHRFVSAVAYLQAQRLRTEVMRRFESELADYDVILGKGIAAPLISTTNCTGHPQVLIPQGVDDEGRPQSLSLIGRLYQDDALLGIAAWLQAQGQYHTLRPPME